MVNGRSQLHHHHVAHYSQDKTLGSSPIQHRSLEDYERNVLSSSPFGSASPSVRNGGMRRSYKILSPEEVASGKKSNWVELEITGVVRNLSDTLWTFKHLTSLFLNGNQLQRIPPEISGLENLQMLDLSHNKLRSLPLELGEMTSLLHLYLSYNQLRNLPYELGKLFRLQTLGLHGNPLNSEIARIYNEPNGTQRLLQFLLDHLANTAAITQDEAFWLKASSAASNKKYQQQFEVHHSLIKLDRRIFYNREQSSEERLSLAILQHLQEQHRS